MVYSKSIRNLFLLLTDSYSGIKTGAINNTDIRKIDVLYYSDSCLFEHISLQKIWFNYNSVHETYFFVTKQT